MSCGRLFCLQTSAFSVTEKEIDPPPEGCPISSSLMFRPTQGLSSQKLESTAAIIAEMLGLELPPTSSSLSTACGENELDSDSDANLNDVVMTSPDFGAKELLLTLDTKYKDLLDTFEYSKGMPTYFNNIKMLFFAGVGPSFEDIEETKIIEEFWSLYQRRRGLSSSPEHEERSS
ncbi:hypothetical protein AgCh_019636 [Apium graveolens]